MIGKSTRLDWVSLMSAIQRSWSSLLSTLRPMTLTPRRAHSSPSRAVAPSSVVQTGVKSAGCEKSTHQLSPMNSWKRMLPELVRAVKSGTLSPMRTWPCRRSCSCARVKAASGPAYWNS